MRPMVAMSAATVGLMGQVSAIKGWTKSSQPAYTLVRFCGVAISSAKKAHPPGCAAFCGVFFVLHVAQDCAGLGVELDVPLDILGITDFHFVDIDAGGGVLVKLGVGGRRGAWVLGQGGLVEFSKSMMVPALSSPGLVRRTSAIAKPAVRVRTAAVNRVVNFFMGSFLG